MTPAEWTRLAEMYTEATAKRKCERKPPCNPDSYELACAPCTARVIMELKPVEADDEQ